MVDDHGQSHTDSAPVQFGIFDWIDRNQIQLPDLYEQRLQCLEYADEAGFYCYHLAEHQGTPLGMAPSPGVFLAAVIQRTHRLRLGPLVYLLPLYNPLRLVQEICMLDNMSRGRLEVGVGRGVSPYELAFYNVTPQESRTMFREALEILVAGLRTGEVSYAGEYYSFKDVRLHLEPYQRPYPPLWYPTDNTNSITWLAQEGFNTITHYPPMTTMRELFDLYKRVWQEHHTNPDRLNAHVPEPKYGIVRHVYVAETDAQALLGAELAANGLLGEAHAQVCWKRSVETLTARKDDIAGLAVASDERIEACLLYVKGEAEAEILFLRSFVDDDGSRLQQLLSRLRAEGIRTVLFPKVHPAEI